MDGACLGLGFSCQIELLGKVKYGTSLLFIFLDRSQKEKDVFLAHMGLFSFGILFCPHDLFF
jgi:hypothetical protein